MAAEVMNKTLIQNETIILKRECRSKGIFKQLRYFKCLKRKSLIQTSIHIIREVIVMKKILIALFIIGLAVYLTSDSEEKQKRKEYNVEQIEKNIAPYVN